MTLQRKPYTRTQKSTLTTLKNKLKSNRQGTRFEEGLVDSEDMDAFKARLQRLEGVWNEPQGEKGLQFHTWFAKNKADLMKATMLRPLRIRARLHKHSLQTG